MVYTSSPGCHHIGRLPRPDLRAAQRAGDRSRHGRCGVAGGDPVPAPPAGGHGLLTLREMVIFVGFTGDFMGIQRYCHVIAW